ncbi:MAG: hypothetical protein P4N60_08155 [Verrucomicrobiae bacterium]|nr:hypothetical protein [Verrucomicrobiae bacterium]
MKTLKLAPAAVVFACIGLGSPVQAQSLLNVKIGTTANDSSANGAYQESGAAVLGPANSWWNEYAFVSSTPAGVSVVDSQDNALTGIMLTVANSGGVGSKTTSGSNPSFLFASMPYQNSGGVFTISLSGLSANTQYEFVGYAARPTSAAGAAWAVTTGTLNSGITLNDGSSVDISTGAGKAYSEFLATTDGSGDLTITDSGNPGTAITVLDGFQLEVAAVPEPGAWAMICSGCGMLFAFRRYRGVKAG